MLLLASCGKVRYSNVNEDEKTDVVTEITEGYMVRRRIHQGAIG